MSRLPIAVVVVALAACGGGSSSTVQHATAGSVAVQQGDVPAGMVRCDLSGDIDTFLGKVKSSDPSTYQTTKSEWDDARSKGASAAAVAFYSDSQAHCDTIKATGPDIGAATYKLVINFVVQFKDEASAAKAYTGEGIFGTSTVDLRKGPNAIQGQKTGLSANSVVLEAPIANQTYYIAVWQNKAFMVILVILNVDSAAANKVATAENSRIK